MQNCTTRSLQKTKQVDFSHKASPRKISQNLGNFTANPQSGVRRKISVKNFAKFFLARSVNAKNLLA